MNETMIDIESLCFKYRNEDPDWILDHISLHVEAGEWLAITGHNGSGKSTLAKCLNGLLVPEQGSVKVKGFFTSDEDSLWEIRRSVGMVFQNPDNQFVGTTVRDDVAFGMENHGVPREEMVQRLSESLELVGMSEFQGQEPHRLSGGQKQRVAIAGIVALRPSIIILDEATSMLDPRGKSDVLKVMHELNKTRGITVISITHDLEEASSADRMIVMDEGRIVREGTPIDIFKEPEGLVEMGLDLPFTVKLRQLLIEENGLNLSEKAFTEKELVDELWKLQLNI
ncbi:energy-coupling factor transport system ATP-binding protein [Pullulanibacillus pueri]|uniref:Energy-coupling factor transporter ATP-binding protein EcfA1 n=1 Tax=Pullulanibacillus pueri TaxID=1437324 RepID=A0A8J2ZYI7_9BACL|nr:energy-coupling factor transport system ATP-binding protein [Pullulanibacillus pueri]GGH85310.1 energy-coupling factor transporter ATP-binding protein EcfA1 [Pullulanibacillus pueri]